MTNASLRFDTASPADVHVAFDFDGALELARRLTALADDWERAFAAIGGVADAALVSWSGPNHDRVADRFTAHRHESITVVESLRTEAERWARAWAAAADELRHRRWIATTGAALDGPYRQPPHPVGVPAPPTYAPTADVATGGWS